MKRFILLLLIILAVIIVSATASFGQASPPDRAVHVMTQIPCHVWDNLEKMIAGWDEKLAFAGQDESTPPQPIRIYRDRKSGSFTIVKVMVATDGMSPSLGCILATGYGPGVEEQGS